jgi:hypothetical protein
VKKSQKIFSLTGLLVAAMLVLSACADEAPTGTPVPPTPTVAPTTAAATATTSASLPTISGVTEIQGDSSISAEVAKQLGVPTLTVKLYTSDDDAAVVGDHADTALTGQGYSFGIPNQTKPVSQDNGTVGLYSRSGSDDVLFTAIPVPANADVSGSIPGIDAATAQKFTDQVKGKKTLLVVMSGPSLLQALIALGQGSSAQTAAATTGGTVAAATPTVAGTALAGTPTNGATTPTAGTGNATATVASGTLPAGTAPVSYTGATIVQLPNTLKSTLLSGLSAAKNATLDGYRASDPTATVKNTLQSSYAAGGWTDATAAFTGASDALTQIGPDAFFIAYTKDNKLSFVLGFSGATASALGITGVDANGTVYIIGTGEK